jgi:formamidopyrimidine-DNA glycosylase
LSFSPAGAELPAELHHIARDPLDPEFDDDAFVAKVRRRASGIKRQLLDQNLVSGVGNIYADEALGQGGTSFDALYVNVNGESGYFDRSLHAFGREGEPCDRCGAPMRRMAFMNRSSYFCPVCQPAPRRRRAAAPQAVARN